MKYIEWFGKNFIGLFEAGGEQFMGFMTGIVPLLIVLLTFTYSVIAFIGQDRVDRAIRYCSKYMLLRYSIMPILSVMMLTNPMAGELFVYLGIANGVMKAGYSQSSLAVRYFLVGVVVILFRGIVTERLTKFLIAKESKRANA